MATGRPKKSTATSFLAVRRHPYEYSYCSRALTVQYLPRILRRRRRGHSGERQHKVFVTRVLTFRIGFGYDMLYFRCPKSCSGLTGSDFGVTSSVFRGLRVISCIFRVRFGAVTLSHVTSICISTLAGAPFQARKANYLIGVFVCLLKLVEARR